MEQELPSRINGIKPDEVEYNYLLEAKLIKFFNVKFGIDFDRTQKNDPIIARLVKTVINRAFVLQNPAMKKRFCKSFNDPKVETTSAHYLIELDEAIANEAARSVLAERRLLTYIMKGHYSQPWVVRPEFDQELKAIRIELGLNLTHKMENPRIFAILNPAQATWRSQPKPVAAPVRPPQPVVNNYWPSSSPGYGRYAPNSRQPDGSGDYNEPLVLFFAF
jgi:hypothetical protein